MQYKGYRPLDSSVRFEFTANSSTGARVDMSATPTQADFQVFKDGSLMTLDALSIIVTKVAATTGVYEVEVDTSVDADFTAGSHYSVLMYPDETIDSQSVTAWLGSFDIGVQPADVTQWLGTAAATPTTAGVPEVDVTHWLGTAAATPTTAGVPEVDITYVNGDATAAANLEAMYNGTGYAGGSTKLSVDISAQSVDDIWDEDMSGHQTANSAGQAQYIIRSATAQGGTTSSVTLDASASTSDDAYNNQAIYIVSGTGAGQGSIISDYTGSSRSASIADTWLTAPSTDSVFVIRPFGSIPGATAPSASTVAAAVWDRDITLHTSESSAGSMLQPFHVGTAQAGSANSITLDATGSSATNNFYNYAVVEIIGGTGAGQSRQITAYNGTTKVATVDPAWTTSPTIGSEYIIRGLGIDAATVEQIADSVWDEARSGHVAAGTFGEYVLADSTRISGSVTAADGLESAVAGTTPLPSNVTRWLGTAVATPTTAGVPEVDVTFVGGVAEDLPTATALATVDANVDAILVDTGTDIPATLGSPVGASLSADIAAVQTTATAIEADTQNIQSRLPASLNNGMIAADIQRINDVPLIGDGSGTPFSV